MHDILSDVSVSPEYAVNDVGSAQDFVCTATGDSSINIMWKSSDGSDVTASANQEDYDSGARISTLSFATLALDDDDSYTCYIEFGDSESTEESVQLDVIGMHFY